jgi:hypothetical protein
VERAAGAYPVTIHGEIRGEGQSLEEAEPRLASAVGNTLPIIAVATNAAIADPLAVAAHGLDLSTPQRFVMYHPPESTEWFPPGGRRIDADATLALMRAVGTHPRTDLLHRSFETYRRALTHWVPEEHLLAGEFLYISAETLSRFLIESRAASKGITPKNLVRLEGAAKEAELRRGYLRDGIFGGDGPALLAMEAASNGFEHGYMSVDQVRGLLDSALSRSMGLVRRALIEASGVEVAMRKRLLDRKYEEPRGLVPVIRFAEGHLSRVDEHRPPPHMDIAPVEVDWEVKQLAAEVGVDGKVNITWSTKLTATKLPNNTQIGAESFGMRAAYVTPLGGPMAGDAQRAGEHGSTDDPQDAEANGDFEGERD